MEFSSKPIFLICGHYGVGKTNVSVEFAKRLNALERHHTILLDFDIVNPYFRSADNAESLRALGIEVICPEYANTNVDIPTLPPQVNRVFETDCTAVFDIGGDDSGATALGTYRSRIEAKGYELYVVINACRPYIKETEDALSMIKEIESSSLLKASGIINNTNLGTETDLETVREGFDYAKKICEAANLPLICTTCFADIADRLTPQERHDNRVLKIGDATKKIF